LLGSALPREAHASQGGSRGGHGGPGGRRCPRDRIEAVTGETVSDSVSTGAETKLPPLREARLQGWFHVRVRVIDQSGYDDFNSSRFKASLRFMPRCPKGACAVRWKMYREDAHRVLRRRGARYSGASPVTSASPAPARELRRR
jgi:hypothetical protein